VTVRVSRAQALAWRMRRHLLDPVGELGVVDVVRRLCGVQAQVASSAELAVRVRQRASGPDEVTQALSEGRLVRTWAMRGALHLLPPEDGGAFLALMAAGRSWTRPSWQRAFGATPDEMDALRDAVREALEGRALTREELVGAVVERPGLAHVGDALRSGWGTLLKPLAWQGVVCHGPAQGAKVTFARPEDVSAGWAGLPDADEAAPAAIAAYLGAHGPATTEAFSGWLSGGWFGQRQLRAWFGALGDRLLEVDVDGEPAWLLAEHVDELASTRPSDSVRLLPGFDQWVLGPGTADGHVVPRAQRAEVSRQAGWIAPVVIVGGVVSGTWALEGDGVAVRWFSDAGAVPAKELEQEVQRLAALVGRGLDLLVVDRSQARSESQARS
jgi:hypothetical protein